MKLFIATLVALLPIISFATDAIDALQPFIGKTGAYSEFGRSGGTCTISINEEDKTIIINGNGGYYNGDSVEASVQLVSDSSDRLVFLSDENGKRPGGDQCGDFGGMFNFKKQLIVNLKDKNVSIVSTFRCLTDAGKKSELNYSCKF